MAAILQFRQGSKASFISSGPYISEPFFDTDTNIIHIGVSGSSTITLTKLEDINSGSFSVSGDISGSNLYLSGDITASNTLLSGDITIGGNIILGDQVQDNITVSGQFDSDLIPSASATFDLGSTTKKWNHLYALSASIDSVDLVANLPSGVISGSVQISSLGFDGYGSWSANADNLNSIYITSGRTLYFEGGDGIITEARNPGNYYITIDLDTGSAHFTNAVAGVGAPQGTVSGSQQVIDLLPSGVVSGSEQLPSGLISGSTQVVNSLPTGTVSGSVQVLGGTNIVSSSQQVINFLPQGTVSGSSQVVDVLTQVNSFTSSQESKNTTLATYTGSVDTSISSLNSFTNSFDTAISLNSSDVTVLGNLTVQGTQTQLNTSTLNVEDLNILLASGSTTSAAADGAGITIDGADKSLQWEHGTSQFVFDAQVSSSVGFKGDGSNLTGLTADFVEYDNILNKPTLVSGSDQILGGTNIVSSSTQVTNFLPGGTVSGSIQVLGGTSIVSSSTQVTNFLPSGTVSGSTQIIKVLETQTPGLVSGSDQVTASLDLKYLEIDGDSVLSSSNENFTDYSQSVDLRLLSGFASGSATSQSLHTLVGNFPTSGSLGTAAFYNVSSSLADDPNVVPNVKAVYDYINNVVQAADITGVSASLGLSGGGNAGYVSLSLDTGSSHFTDAVSALAGIAAGTVSGSSQLTSSFDSRYLNTNGDNVVSSSAQITNGSGLVSGSSQVSYTGLSNIPAGIVSGSSQISLTQTDSGSFTTDMVGEGSINLYYTDARVKTKLDAEGVVSGSSFYVDSNDFSFGGTPSNVAGLNQLTLRDDTAGYSGLLAFQDNTVVKSFDYVVSNVRYVDTNSGVSIVLKPDANATKSWVIDTDGDLVSNGGSWQSGSAYMNNLIASSSVTASNLFVKNDITTNNLNTDGNVTISGNLTVAGTTTYTSTNNVNIGDNILELNFGGSATTSGILTKDATGVSTTSGSLLWDATNDYWKAGKLGSEAKILLSLGDGVVSGSDQITKTLQEVTTAGNTTSNAVSITNSTASTSKTTGALIVSGGVGVSGAVNVGGDVVAFASSDKRLKDEIQPISDPISKINQIGGYSFLWNNEKQNIYNGKDYGVIAQEIEEILPELVITRDNGYKAVKYDRLVSLLIEGIKELSSEVKELKETINRE